VSHREEKRTSASRDSSYCFALINSADMSMH
jgi:hypothetical protein